MMDDVHGDCHICRTRIDSPSASSTMQHKGMELGYINGNGKRRIYCMTCILQALHFFTLIREDMNKFIRSNE